MFFSGWWFMMLMVCFFLFCFVVFISVRVLLCFCSSGLVFGCVCD